MFHGRGILRPAMDAKNLQTLAKVNSLIHNFNGIFIFFNLVQIPNRVFSYPQNAENCLPNCKIQTLDRDAAENMVPNLSVPFGLAFYMPEALNVHPLQYLQVRIYSCTCPCLFSVIVFIFNVVCYLRFKALYLACEDQVEQSRGGKELNLYTKTVDSLLDLAGKIGFPFTAITRHWFRHHLMLFWIGSFGDRVRCGDDMFRGESGPHLRAVGKASSSDVSRSHHSSTASG